MLKIQLVRSITGLNIQKKERIVPLGDYDKEYLISYLEVRNSLIKRKNGNPDKLFLNNHGKPITRNGRC